MLLNISTRKTALFQMYFPGRYRLTQGELNELFGVRMVANTRRVKNSNKNAKKSRRGEAATNYALLANPDSSRFG